MKAIMPYDFKAEIDYHIYLQEEIGYSIDLISNFYLLYKMPKQLVLDYLDSKNEAIVGIMLWILGESGSRKYVFILRNYLDHPRHKIMAQHSLRKIEPVPTLPHIIYLEPRKLVQLKLAM